MIEINNVITPGTGWWLQALEGMRYPYKSIDKNDSFYCYGEFNSNMYPEECLTCSYCDFIPNEDEDLAEVICNYNMGDEGFPTIVLGKNDRNLLLNLCKNGSSHRKVLRQLPVLIEINAPIFWWKQLDQYKTGTTTNSESLMHTMLKKPFELCDFSFDCFDEAKEGANNLDWENKVFTNSVDSLLTNLNFIREQAVQGDKEAWSMILELLPQSYKQKRIWTGNYEVLLNIIDQRVGHQLPEWNDFIIKILKEVPYLKDICFATDVLFLGQERNDLGEKQRTIMYKDRKNGEVKKLCWYEDIVDHRYY